MYTYNIGGTGRIRVGPEAPRRGQCGLRLCFRNDDRLVDALRRVVEALGLQLPEIDRGGRGQHRVFAVRLCVVPARFGGGLGQG